LLTSARGAKHLKIRKTPRSQVLAPQGPRTGEEEHTHSHTLKAYVEEDLMIGQDPESRMRRRREWRETRREGMVGGR